MLIPFITVDQMKKVDQLMETKYHISLFQMMENAGRNLALIAKRNFFKNNCKGKTVVVLTGPGGNGGGAMVAARNLQNWGALVDVVIVKDQNQYSGVASSQLKILESMGIDLCYNCEFEHRKYDLVIDGLLGYSLNGQPKGCARDLIEWANSQPFPVLSLDIPSGMDGTSGEIYEPCIRAYTTLTLALPKTGFLQRRSKFYTGELFLCDISVPEKLYKELGIELPDEAIFSQDEIVKIY